MQCHNSRRPPTSHLHAIHVPTRRHRSLHSPITYSLTYPCVQDIVYIASKLVAGGKVRSMRRTSPRQSVEVLPGSPGDVVALVADATHLYAAAKNTICVWRHTGDIVHAHDLNVIDTVTCMASAGGRLYVGTKTSSKIKVWEGTKLIAVRDRILRAGGDITCIAVDSNVIVAAVNNLYIVMMTLDLTPIRRFAARSSMLAMRDGFLYTAGGVWRDGVLVCNLKAATGPLVLGPKHLYVGLADRVVRYVLPY
jgi:hypothetical protein